MYASSLCLCLCKRIRFVLSFENNYAISVSLAPVMRLMPRIVVVIVGVYIASFTQVNVPNAHLQVVIGVLAYTLVHALCLVLLSSSSDGDAS